MAELNQELAVARMNMVEQQVRTWDVLDQRVLDLLEALPRDQFVEEAHRRLAYVDMNLPLPHDQEMLSPKLEGRILQSLAIQPTERVLEIGTGSGYLTACLARLAAHVTSVDIYPDLQERARERLLQHDIHNVTLVEGDSARGWDDGKRYDAIAVTGSIPELHEGFHRSLTIGGRLFLIVGEDPIMEGLLITRVAEDQWATESVLDTRVKPLANATPLPRFRF